MSFTSGVKEDLNRVVSSKPCCRRAEFSAFFLINGTILISGDHQLSLLMATENTGTARKMFTLAKDFRMEREIAVYRRARLKKNQVYNLRIPLQPAVKEFLAWLGMVEEDMWSIAFPAHLRGQVLADACCRRAYLRGAFLASGSVSNPQAGPYHLEIGSLDMAQAELIRELLNGFDLPAKIVRRKEKEIVYLKGAEAIGDFLILVGSHRSLLEFESVRVTKQVRNQANRLRNCDTANIEKTVTAAARQQQDIDCIAASIGLQALPPHLREAALLRREHPEASLNELSELSSLGRSALNHRFRRLGQIAENISLYGRDGWDKH